MPFQVSFSTRHRQFKQVTLITAGEDQLHICTPTIYLEGVVEGDLLGHTIEWEQISGTTVTLQQANTLTPFFDFVDTTDKIFRLWIDRGTPYEQYDDVRILKTPTSWCNPAFKSDNSSFTFVLDPAPVSCENITPFVSVVVPPPTSTHGEETSFNITVDVSWTHPGDPIQDLHIEQYRVIEDGVEVDLIPDVPIPTAGDILGTAGGPPSEPLTYSGTLAEYRIDTYYNIGGRKFVRESCIKDFTGLTIPSVVAYNDAVDGVTFSSTQTVLSKTIYGNILLPRNEDSARITFASSQSALTRVNYGNVSLRNNDSLVPGLTFSPNHQTINITRYGGSGIGGG